MKPLSDNVEGIFVFLSSKMFNLNNFDMSCYSSNAQVTFVETPQLKIISFQNDTH